MKNIKRYEDFKKIIKEEVEFGGTHSETGVHTSTRDPFINVSGNFAGADKTLIGSAVFRLFNFAKRKGMQMLMYTWLKPALRKSYMKGLMKYLMINNLELPKGKIFFDIIKLNEKGEKTEEKYNVKFVKNEKDLNFPEIESIIYDKENNKLEQITGTFNFSDMTNLVIENGIVKDKVGIIEGSKVEEESEEQEDITSYNYDELVKYLREEDKNYTEIANYVFNTIRDGGIIKEEVKKEIKNVLSSSENYIKEIEKQINDKKSKNIAESERYLNIWTAYQKLSKYLIDMINNYTIDDTKKEYKKVQKVNDKEFKIINKIKQPVEVQNESIDFLNEEINAMSKTQNKLKSSSDYIKKVDHLSEKYPDITSEEFIKLFTNKRDDVSKIVLHYKPEIVKIQLGAQRLYSDDVDEKTRVANINDKKLYNNWIRMVNSVKSEFSQIMNTDIIDPLVLIKNEDISKYKDDSNNKNTSPFNKSVDIIEGNKITQNHDKLQMTDFGSSHNITDLFLINLSIKEFSGFFICKIHKYQIETKNYQAIELLKYIKDSDSFFKQKETNYSKYIAPITEIEGFIKPNYLSLTSSSYISTFIIRDQKFEFSDNLTLIVNIYKDPNDSDKKLLFLHRYNTKSNPQSEIILPEFNKDTNNFQGVSIKILRNNLYLFDETTLNKKYSLDKNIFKIDIKNLMDNFNLKNICINFFKNILKR